MQRSFGVWILLSPVLTALLLAVPLVAVADDQSKPPPGIVATSATLVQILRLHDENVGVLDAGTPNTRREAWRLDEAGFAGEETLTRSGLDYRATTRYGPYTEE